MLRLLCCFSAKTAKKGQKSKKAVGFPTSQKARNPLFCFVNASIAIKIEFLLIWRNIKKEQKDINTFKISANKKFNNIWLENVYKLNYVNNELVKTNIDKVTYNKTQDSIALNLEKNENCVGYYFEVKVAYILKDIRGFMYYTGSMVLF